MALALAGIVFFQVRWIKTSYLIWQEQFDTNVREALTSAIEKNLHDKLISLSKSYVLENTPGMATVKVVTTDSIRDISKIFFSIDESELIHTEDFDELRTIVNISDSVNVTLKKRNKKADRDLDIHICSESLIHTLDTNIFYFDEDSFVCKTKSIIMTNESWLDTIVEHVIESTDGTPARSYDEFKNTLDQELIKLDIDIPYLLGVFDINKKNFDYLFPESIDTSLLQSGYKIPLLGHQAPASFASLYFPTQKSYIWQKLFPVLIGSISLFLIISASFILMFHTIFKQKKLSQIKSDFVNNMTHELKTPISTVSLALEALQDFDGLKDRERTNKYLNIARNENSRLGLLVNKILKMSTYEKSDLQLHHENCDIHECIRNVCRNFDVQLRQEAGIIYQNLEAERSIVNVDRIHFNSVIYNLLDNALKYSGEKPEIFITTVNRKNDFQVEISDNGPGISKQHQQKIFDKFYRIPSGDLHKVKGHGLGLSYVKKIVEAHGGSISLESKPDKGSRFILSFPQDKSDVFNFEFNY